MNIYAKRLDAGKFGGLAAALLLAIGSGLSAAPTYVANLTNAPGIGAGPTPLVRSAVIDQNLARHGEGIASAGSALTSSIATSQGARGLDNGIFTQFDANMASFYDDIVITGPAAATIPVAMHVPFRATYTQSWDAMDLPDSHFTDYSQIFQETDIRARLGSPQFGFTDGRIVLALNDKDSLAAVTPSTFNLGVQTPLAQVLPGVSPGPETVETIGGITLETNVPLDAGGFLYLNRVQSPITLAGGPFGPGVGFHFDDVVTLSGEFILPGIAQLGVPMTVDLTLSTDSRASGGIQISSAGELNVLNNVGVSTAGAVFDLPAGYTVDSPSLGIVNNAVTSFVGNLPIRNNTQTGVIDIGGITTIGGDLDISGNGSAAVIDASSLTTVSGDLDIADNATATVIDIGSVNSVGGDLTIIENGSATVNANASLIVGGDLNLESTGSGVFNVGQAGGDLDLGLTGYTEVNAQTAGGQTSVALTGGTAKMQVTLPDGAFPVEHVPFSVREQPADPAGDWSGEPTATLAKYEFDFAITTLDQDAELNFEIDVDHLAPDIKTSLLALLHAGSQLTVGVQGDEPGAAVQLFDVCEAGADPTSGCVAVRWLDAGGGELVPYGGVDPATIRFESLVGHFSTYRIVALNQVPEPAEIELSLAAMMTLGLCGTLRTRGKLRLFEL